MKYCHHCKCAHEAHREVCSECGQKLEIKETFSEETLKSDGTYEKINQLFLAHASTNNEAHMLISQLNTLGINAELRYEGAGSYFNIIHGNNFQGVDVYVSEKNLEEARRIVSDFTYTYAAVEKNSARPISKKKDLVNKIVAFVILSILLLLLLIPSIKSVLMWR